jgi:hypothetical protein
LVRVNGNTISIGPDPNTPQVGDMRITFKQTLPNQTVSLIAKQIGDTFESYRAKNGRSVSLLSIGTHSAESMYEDAQFANTVFTWILRAVGVFCVCISLALITAPLSVLASVIPFLGRLVGVGTGLFSLVFGIAWSLFIIALAWLFYRPLIGIIILAAAVGLIAMLLRKRPISTETKKPELTI